MIILGTVDGLVNYYDHAVDLPRRKGQGGEEFITGDISIQLLLTQIYYGCWGSIEVYLACQLM
jgi:hypothetical protein